ncbi:cysteine-rich CWC family protein [Aliivibrio sifiae]|uniref:DUF1289 domain-containing protein n=1 Tax=Aliivibrio sifiae TaxID=566293 RepID=A0A2S7X7M0_9GAMM|nr:cysteine-rich CWC family protein [Aliivibrio sifiae]PQJ87125.1 DUF1289 domain-containing protein [Aliivibrio sifiae]GLR73741.1 hypothetical protein GCM10007855_06150 [Aliivibrio sifiae]
MKTPCIAACKNEGGICIGCKRTITEIIEWKSMTDIQRENVMDRLSGKTSTHTCPECEQPAQCDIKMGKETCWCFEVETRDVGIISENSECLCQHCLSKKPIA